MGTEVFFTTNEADFPRLEGLYISERKPPGFIQGQDLSRVGMYGRCVRGPSGPQEITSSARFTEIYGERDFGAGGDLIGEIWKGLLNKPFGTLVIDRVVASDAVAASFDVETAVDGTGAAIIRIEGANKGLWAQDVFWKVEDASDGDAEHFNVVIKYLGVEVTHENLNTFTASDDNLAEVVGDDIANRVVITKLADGRPNNNATVTEAAFVTARDSDDFVQLGLTIGAYDTVVGSEGAVAVTDYNAVLAEMAAFEGIAIVILPESLEDTVAGGAQGTHNGVIVTTAPTVSDRIFLTWSGLLGQTPAQDKTSKLADITTPSDRIIWNYNPAKTLDPDTGLKITQGAHVWMASILSQTDVDIHPGERNTIEFTAGISELENQTLTRGDLILLRDAGISQLERLPDGFVFRSGITTTTETGLTEITRRRSADFLQLSAANRLKTYVKSKNTVENRALMAGELTAFSDSLRDDDRIVEEFSVEQESVNTANQRAQGIEKLLWRVKLINHMLHLVLETEIGTGVVIEVS